MGLVDPLFIESFNVILEIYFGGIILWHSQLCLDTVLGVDLYFNKYVPLAVE